ncbi:MAG: hypothetical protein HKO53_18915 [Gemmatimonadetes bacterium]|nr:hypothetical protein [Gemmatimonadota bacterium]
MRRGVWTVAPLALALLAACGDSTTDPVVDPDPDPPITGPDTTDVEGSFCEEIGYACTIDGVDPAVGERSQTLLEDAKARIDRGDSNEAVAAWLEEQDGVVSATAQESLLVFRLGGGQPTWLLTPPPGAPPSTGLPSIPPLVDNVVGHGTARERADRKKSAVVLAAFRFQFGILDVAPTLESMLSAHEEYQGRVQYESNESLPPLPTSDEATTGSVTVDHFRGWGERDVIVVSTHGDVLVALGDEWGCFFTCIQGVATGERVRNCDAAIRAKYAGVPGVRCGAVSGVDGTYIWLDSDFFRWEYRLAATLSQSIIYFGACRTSSLSSLAIQLSSVSNEFFGWDANVDAAHEAPVARRLFALMITEGLTTKGAYDQLDEDGMTDTPSADLDLFSNDDGLHIREIATLKNPLHPSVSNAPVFGAGGVFASAAAAQVTGPSAFLAEEGDLMDNAVLPFLGRAGDGENDELFFYVDVDGVRPGREAQYDVTVSVDEMEVGTHALEGFRVERVDEYTVRVEIRQPLDFDVQDGQTLKIRATANLPGDEDAESWDEVSIVARNPVLAVHSVIETTGGDITAVSEVQAEIPLTLEAGEDIGDLRIGEGSDVLEYVRFEVDIDASTGCTVTGQTVDGELRIVDGSVAFDDPLSPDWGVPEELVLFPPPEIEEILILECGDVTQTLPFIHWFAGFSSFHGGGFGHPNELDEGRGGYVITGWEPGSEGVYARRTYDRSGTEDETTLTETTVLELRGPTYDPS